MVVAEKPLVSIQLIFILAEFVCLLSMQKCEMLDHGQDPALRHSDCSPHENQTVNSGNSWIS